jgi:hypothetical protein
MTAMKFHAISEFIFRTLIVGNAEKVIQKSHFLFIAVFNSFGFFCLRRRVQRLQYIFQFICQIVHFHAHVFVHRENSAVCAFALPFTGKNEFQVVTQYFFYVPFVKHCHDIVKFNLLISGAHDKVECFDAEFIHHRTHDTVVGSFDDADAGYVGIFTLNDNIVFYDFAIRKKTAGVVGCLLAVLLASATVIACISCLCGN